MSLSRRVTGDFNHNTQQQEFTESPVVFFFVIFCFFLDFVSFYFSCKLGVSFLGAGCLRKWVKLLKKGNPSSSKMRKKNLSPVSLQWCHPFLPGQGEQSRLRPRCICHVGEDVFIIRMPFPCSSHDSFPKRRNSVAVLSLLKYLPKWRMQRKISHWLLV